MGHSILLVENNPISLKLESFLLEVAGYSVVKTNHNELAKLLNSATVRPDLVLVNIQEQEPGRDSLGIIRLLKANPLACNVPVLILATADVNVTNLLAAGCTGCLLKPIEYRKFLTEISQQLGR